MIDVLTTAELRFEDPWVLALVGVAVLAFALNLLRERRPGGLLFSSLGLLPRNGPSWRVRLRWATHLLRLSAVALLALAFARPQVALATLEVPTEGIDISLVLDVSSSMTLRDFGGVRRIDALKRVVDEFLGGLKNDRAGIVVFSGEAMLLSPLTLDHKAAQRLAAGIEAGRMLRDGTAIGTGLATGINVLRGSHAKSKVAIVVSDGENNLGTILPLDGAEMARLLGVRLYTIGVIGRAGSPDEQLMRRMAELTEGRYYRASDPEALREIYREIAQLEKSRVGVRGFTSFQDVYPIFLVPGFALLLLELILGATLLRRAP